MPADGNRRDALQRAYSVFEVKAVDDDGTLRGIATTPTTDRSGDIVMPKGAQFKLPLPLLWQHDAGEPIGNVTEAKVTDKGIEIVAKIALGVTQEIDRAFKLIKAKLVRGLSIGFRSIDAEQIPNSWGMIFNTWEMLEVSAVTIPANAEATITSVKSFSQAASGHRTVKVSPVASGTSASADTVKIPKPEEGSTVNTQQQIKSFTEARAAKLKAMGEIMEASEKSGESLDADQQARYNELEAEIDTIDNHLKNLAKFEAKMASQATRVTTATPDPNDPEAVRKAAAERGTVQGQSVIAVEKKLPPGIGFARLAGLVAGSNGDLANASNMARELFPNETPLHGALKAMQRYRGQELIEKAAVAVGNTTDATWAGPLVQYQDLMTDFIDWLRPQTIVGKIQGLRRVPFNVRVPRLTSGGSANWVGEGAPKPVTAFSFDNVTLRFTKLASICVITEELARFSSPSAELIIRDNLAAAIIQQMDTDFIDPANAGSANVKPASITNGVTPVVATGTGTEANVRYDIQALFQPFIVANLTPANGVWIMSASTALALSLMVNALGQPSFPGITMNGGTFWGMPVVVSEAAGLVGASEGAHIVILANAADIMLADDGQVTIDVSREASVQMNSTPDNPATAATVMTSLWQNNLVGLRAERVVNWTKARAQAVQYLSAVHWGGFPA